MAKDILKEAIADAKAVREVALANAKAALEEAFTPKLQSMLSAKLSEELDEEINEEEETNEGVEDTTIEETTIEEDSFDEMVNTNEEAADSDDEGYMGKSMDEEIDLEEILSELELEESEEVSEDTVAEGEEEIAEGEEELAEGEEEELEEMQVTYTADTANRVGYEADHVNEDFDLDALLEELDGLDEVKDEVKEEELEESKEEVEETVNPLQSELEEAKDELEETKSALETVRAELNEVNLLNSKLLYVNRIFKANQLDEAQKLRVVETLDKAGTAKEAKLIYETIKDTFTISKESKQVKKASIKEGLGMASKAAGKSTAPKSEVLSESNDMMSRFQKLANIKINQ
jgi:hypothetical protein